MEHFEMDISLAYRDEDFEIGSQMSSASSARSFSAAPPYTPFTPQSEYEVSPPEIPYMEDYFATNIKTEIPVYDEQPSTPRHKAATSPYSMNLQQATLLNSSLSPYGTSMEFTYQHGFNPCSFAGNSGLSSFNALSPPCSAQHPAYDNANVWVYPPDHGLRLLNHVEATPLSAPEKLSSKDGDISPQQGHDKRRRLPEKHIGQNSSSLHRVHTPTSSKRSHNSGFEKIHSGLHKCHMPECAGKKGYKRAEHLKRHLTSVHNPVASKCEFCGHDFNRMDNWKSHVALHAKRDRSSTSRTTYFPEAEARLREIMERTKRRNVSKKSLSRDEVGA